MKRKATSRAGWGEYEEISFKHVKLEMSIVIQENIWFKTRTDIWAEYISNINVDFNQNMYANESCETRSIPKRGHHVKESRQGLSIPTLMSWRRKGTRKIQENNLRCNHPKDKMKTRRAPLLVMNRSRLWP